MLQAMVLFPLGQSASAAGLNLKINFSQFALRIPRVLLVIGPLRFIATLFCDCTIGQSVLVACALREPKCCVYVSPV
uniref:Putative secreted protein n=1 Tax=Anopheles marajoara TaxID=58244 RepID=A0A2M4CCS7_9DIPT